MAERSFGPVVVRRRLGSELRRLRDHAGMSLEQVARELEVSPSKISRLETGQSPAKLWDVRNLLTLYGVEDAEYRRRAERWVNEGKSEGWWHPYSDASPADLDHYVSLEAEAATINAFCAHFLHGLLQTESYARALIGAISPELSPQDSDGLVNVRMKRQRLFLRAENQLTLNVVIDESALRLQVGDREAMRAQCSHLLELSEVHDIRVRTFEAGPHVALQGAFTIFIPREDDIDPTVVNLESAFHDAYWEESTVVDQFQASFGALSESSLSREKSKSFVRRLVDEVPR